MNIAATKDGWIHRHPLVFSSLLTGTPVAIELLLKMSADLLSLQSSVITVGIISGLVLTAVAAIAVTRLGLWHQLRMLGRPQRARTLLWFLPFVIYGVLPLTQGLDVTASKAAGAIAFGLSIAFWKLIVLALLLYAWLPRGERMAAGLAALFWAAMHFVGGILTGAALAPTLILCVSYLFLAFAFVAVRLRTGRLWPLTGCYALLLAAAAATQKNEASNLAATVADMMPALVISALLAGYGLIAWPRNTQTANQELRHVYAGDQS
jgi:hypothetical protein